VAPQQTRRTLPEQRSRLAYLTHQNDIISPHNMAWALNAARIRQLARPDALYTARISRQHAFAILLYSGQPKAGGADSSCCGTAAYSYHSGRTQPETTTHIYSTAFTRDMSLATGLNKQTSGGRPPYQWEDVTR